MWTLGSTSFGSYLNSIATPFRPVPTGAEKSYNTETCDKYFSLWDNEIFWYRRHFLAIGSENITWCWVHEFIRFGFLSCFIKPNDISLQPKIIQLEEWIDVEIPFDLKPAPKR